MHVQLVFLYFCVSVTMLYNSYPIHLYIQSKVLVGRKRGTKDFTHVFPRALFQKLICCQAGQLIFDASDSD